MASRFLLFTTIFLLLSSNDLFSQQNPVDQESQMKLQKTEWDEHGTRYQLVQEHEGEYNWLFVPGGAGADSCYFLPLIQSLNLPGKVWLIDFPGNGTNSQNVSPNYNFDQWSECLEACVKKFKNPIYVGQSFGGMFPLLHPTLENFLNGFIIIAAAPKMDHEESKKLMDEKGIVISPEASQEFRQNPTDETFKKALLARSPCHFSKEGLEEGQKLFTTLPFNFHAMLWWVKKANDLNYDVKWIPQHVPTIIIGGTEDCITPISLFQKDDRFKRENITFKVIEGAGHFPWVERKQEVKRHIEDFISKNLEQE